MLDTLIKDATVVDGTGRPRFVADIGIKDGRIAGVGDVAGQARRTIEAGGLIAAPGFVDIHTHYDAQVLWDPTFSPSVFHGVTTVIGGNCGFTLAPMQPEHTAYITRMLARVEGMPLESLEAGVDFRWSSFAEYLERVGSNLTLNAGFLVGHSTLRRYVMGDDANRRPASEAEIAELVDLVHASIKGGALGFSSSWSETHSDEDGVPVPSRWATREELVALAGAIKGHEGTVLEFLPGSFESDRLELMTAMSLAAGRPLNWNLLGVIAGETAVMEEQLAASDHAATHGAKVVALTLPDVSRARYSFETGFILDAIPGWASLFQADPETRIRMLSDPQERRRLAESALTHPKRKSHHVNWPEYKVLETFSPDNDGVAGRTIGEVAAERGHDPFATLLDVVVADRLKTGFLAPALGDDEASWKLRGELLRDPRTVVGGTDSGAHLDLLSTFSATTSLLANGVRQRGLLTLEEAIHQLTDVPASLYGLKGRGRLQEGAFADIVLFDADTVGPGPIATRHDLPAGAPRLYGEAHGIQHVLVNGVEVLAGQQLTGESPGTLLRPGRDTVTVGVPGRPFLSVGG